MAFEDAYRLIAVGFLFAIPLGLMLGRGPAQEEVHELPAPAPEEPHAELRPLTHSEVA